MNTPDDLREEIVSFLCSIPNLHTVVGRQALIYSLSIDDILVRQILFDGTTEQFCQNLISTFERYKRFDSKNDPLEEVLKLAKRNVGNLKRQDVDILIQKWHLFRDKQSTQENKRTPANFIRLIGVHTNLENSENVYFRINELFVKPNSYDTDIKRILDEHHILFIIGDPHIGKTFTAVHLLWEFYQSGYKPFWVSTSQLVSFYQTSQIGYTSLFDEYLKNKRAIYFEDPFGRTSPIEIQEFLSVLHRLIIRVKELDIRVIITSRTSIFNEVVKNKFAKYVVSLTQKLELGKAYDSKKIFQILRKYAKFYDSQWLYTNGSNKIIKIVGRRLEAPHNIELFVRANRYKKNASDILEKLPFFHDVVLELGREISKLSLWQKGFLLCIHFFSNYDIPENKTKQVFDAAAKNGIFGSTPVYAWENAFERLEEFLTYHEILDIKYFSFRHPSIAEGFDFCVEGERVLLTMTKKMIENNISNINSTNVKIGAFECFLHYNHLYGDDTWESSTLKDFLDSSDTSIRELSREFVVLKFNKLSSFLKEEIFKYAEKFFNERFLLKLIVGAQLPSNRRLKIASILSKTWDTWVKYKLAINLNLIGKDDDQIKSIGLHLLNDDSIMVRRATVGSLISIFILKTIPDWELAHTVVKYALKDNDYGIKMEIIRVLNEIGDKKNSIKESKLYKELFHSLDILK